MRKILTCTYRSQRDNADRPGASCNTTSAVMALEASGHPTSEISPLPAGTQPEDWLTEIGDSPSAYAVMKDVCPWFFGSEDKGLPALIIREEKFYPTVRPPEAPLMLDWIVHQAYGRSLLKYSPMITFGMILNEINAGRAVMLEGQLTPEGHIVAAVGYECVEDVGGKPGQLTALILNDPWGDYLTGYENHNGEHVVLPLNVAMKVLRQQDIALKSGHLVVG